MDRAEIHNEEPPPRYAPVCKECGKTCYRAVIYADGSVGCHCDNCYGVPVWRKRAVCEECGGPCSTAAVSDDDAHAVLCLDCGLKGSDSKATKYNTTEGAAKGE